MRDVLHLIMTYAVTIRAMADTGTAVVAGRTRRAVRENVPTVLTQVCKAVSFGDNMAFGIRSNTDRGRRHGETEQ